MPSKSKNLQSWRSFLFGRSSKSRRPAPFCTRLRVEACAMNFLTLEYAKAYIYIQPRKISIRLNYSTMLVILLHDSTLSSHDRLQACTSVNIATNLSMASSRLDSLAYIGRFFIWIVFFIASLCRKNSRPKSYLHTMPSTRVTEGGNVETCSPARGLNKLARLQ